ncbi:hypothetical protein [Bradyrhizobium sp. Bra64]|uniref:hypothetical protein n=1 Tax=Bradyrhizobium sp. Bra64 TaxID=2926009 RepID=UPI00211733B0|nr:hypothetical protein [Bradyrhizobium sp. Bra64]
MALDFPGMMAAEKTLSGRPKWEQSDSVWFCLTGSLEIDGVTIPGLELRGGACQNLPDRAVRFQVQYQPARGPCSHLSRAEWRPMGVHTNKAIGPPELQMLRISETHIHEFEHNWLPDEGRMRVGNLPVARPIRPDLQSFEEFLVFIGEAFRISGMQKVERPGWQEPGLFGIA